MTVKIIPFRLIVCDIFIFIFIKIIIIRKGYIIVKDNFFT